MNLFEVRLLLPTGEASRLLVVARDDAQACEVVASKGTVLDAVLQPDTLPIRGGTRILGLVREYAPEPHQA